MSALNDIRDMVEEGKECLPKGKLDEFGKLLQQSRVRKALRKSRELPFRFEKEGTKAIFNVRER